MSSHPKGTITYLPIPEWSFTRAYVGELWLQLHPDLGHTISGSEVTFTYSPIPGYLAYLKFKDNFWEWSSNHFTLDYIVEWNYEVVFPGGPEATYFLTITHAWSPTTGKYAIIARTAVPTNNYHYALPSRDAPYWTPDPL